MQTTLPILAATDDMIATPWATPLQPLTPIQRVGYLRYVKSVKCVRDMPGFSAGAEYPVTTKTLRACWETTRTNVEGSDDVVELMAQETAVFVNGDKGAAGFIDAKYLRKDVSIADATPITHSLKDFVLHFDPPSVPDVAQLSGPKYADGLVEVERLERFIRKRNANFKFKFYQRDDCVRATLVPGSIVGWQTGLGKSLGMFTIPLIKHGFSATASADIYVDEPVLLVTISDLQLQFQDEAMKWFGVRVPIITRDNYRTIDIKRPSFYVTSYSSLTHPGVLEKCRQFTSAHCDEGTKMKGEDTDVGIATRSLTPAFRSVVTATPIKNRLPDIFWLLWWAAGGNMARHERFVYGGQTTDRESFCETYTITCRNLSKEQESKQKGKKKSSVTRTAMACNILNLWTRTAPLVLRRRKAEVADEMVKKFERPIFVPYGTAQLRVYHEVLKTDYRDKNGRVAQGKKLTNLRKACAAPTTVRPDANEMTPKIFTALQLLNNAINRGEQSLVFSAFHETTDCIARLLRSAGVNPIILDGRETSERRAELVRWFKKSDDPVMLAGSKAMAYGHSLPRVNNVITTTMDWAMDEALVQSVDRAWRLDSLKDLTFTPVIIKGSVEERIWNLGLEKRNSSELVLDGEEGEELESALNIADILKFSDKDFARSETIDELKIESDWERLCMNFGSKEMAA